MTRKVLLHVFPLSYGQSAPYAAARAGLYGADCHSLHKAGGARCHAPQRYALYLIPLIAAVQYHILVGQHQRAVQKARLAIHRGRVAGGHVGKIARRVRPGRAGAARLAGTAGRAALVRHSAPALLPGPLIQRAGIGHPVPGPASIPTPRDGRIDRFAVAAVRYETIRWFQALRRIGGFGGARTAPRRSVRKSLRSRTIQRRTAAFGAEAIVYRQHVSAPSASTHRAFKAQNRIKIRPACPPSKNGRRLKLPWFYIVSDRDPGTSYVAGALF